MRDLSSLRCVNCGTLLDPPLEGARGVICQVCQYYNDLSLAPESLELTPDTLEASLNMLVTQARASGMSLDEIIRVLRDELEFTAELASSGRHLSVQIIDLGPLEAEGLQRPIRNRDSLLRGRVVEG